MDPLRDRSPDGAVECLGGNLPGAGLHLVTHEPCHCLALYTHLVPGLLSLPAAGVENLSCPKHKPSLSCPAYMYVHSLTTSCVQTTALNQFYIT